MQEENNSFRLDKTAFKMGKADDASLQQTNYHLLTWQERLRIAHYLTSAAYNLPVGNWPPMDKTYFTIRSR